MCHVADWPFTSLSATQRYVRNWGQSGSACCKLKTTRLTPPGFNKPSATAVSMAGSGSATVKRQWRLRCRSRCRATLRVRSWHLPRPAETAFALGRGDRLVHQRRGGSQRSGALRRSRRASQFAIFSSSTVHRSANLPTYQELLLRRSKAKTSRLKEKIARS